MRTLITLLTIVLLTPLLLEISTTRGGSTPTVPLETSPTPTLTLALSPTQTASGKEPALLSGKLVIDKIEVDAPIEKRGIDDTRQMESPTLPGSVAWYSFSALPGKGSNIVISGHRDLANYGPAVFWNLGELEIGDQIILALGEERYVYSVGATLLITRTTPMNELIAPTETEMLTLITCEGFFDRDLKDYEQRRLVRALRLLN